MQSIKIFQSRELSLYKPILEGLTEDLGFDYYHAILVWCNVISYNGYDKDFFWEVYLVEKDREIIGLAGLSSQYPHNMEDLWLGWFGILPEHRDGGIGSEVLKKLEEYAKEAGAKKLFTYIDKSGAPIKFYYKNDFIKYGTVKQYISNTHPELRTEAFGDMDDIVLFKELA